MEEETEETSFKPDVVEKRLPLNLTVAEWQLLKDYAQSENTELINIVRRSLREHLISQEIELNETLFRERKPGNRLPKKKGKKDPPTAS